MYSAASLFCYSVYRKPLIHTRFISPKKMCLFTTRGLMQEWTPSVVKQWLFWLQPRSETQCSITDYYKDAWPRWKQTEKSDLLREYVRKRKEHSHFGLDSPANHLDSLNPTRRAMFLVSMPTINLSNRLTRCNWIFCNIFRTSTQTRSMKWQHRYNCRWASL